VLTYNAPTLTCGIPRIENAPKLTSHVVQLQDLPLKQCSYMDARSRLGATERDDTLYLGQGQPQTPGLRDEVEYTENIRRICPVAGLGASRWRQDSPRLIQPQRLAAYTAALRHFSDEQTVLHESMIGRAPRGKVKSEQAERRFSDYRPPLAPLAPHQPCPARDVPDALERGGLGAGPRQFGKALALKSDIRRSGWFNSSCVSRRWGVLHGTSAKSCP
jgi:hypothetical protein